MAHSRNIVPSKDALRALRSLAFSPHIALVGTVGSVCGLVAIHHQQQRKVRLAEEILETRRTIHILSKGRGNLHASRMFEAAERGDDFTLHHGRPKKPRRSRQHSSVAAQEIENEAPGAVPETHTTTPAQYIDNANLVFTGPDFPRTNALSANAQGLTQSTHDIGIRRSSDESAPLSTQKGRYLEPVFQELDDDKSPNFPQTRYTQSTHRTTGRADNRFLWGASWMRLTSVEERGSKWTTRLAEAAQERLRKRWSPSTHTNRRALKTILDPTWTVPTNQSLTDLNPVPHKMAIYQNGNEAEVLPGLSAEESIFFNFVFGKPSLDSVFQSGFFQTLDPPNGRTDNEVEPKQQVDMSNNQQKLVSSGVASPSAAVPATEIPYIPLGGPIPAEIPQRPLNFVTKFTTDPDRYCPELGWRDDPARYLYVFNTIGNSLHQEGDAAALALFERTFTAYLLTTVTEDAQLALMLFFDMADRFDPAAWYATVRRAVRSTLDRDSLNVSVVKFLYGKKESLHLRGAGRFYMQPRAYMDEFIRDIRDHDKQISELRKIIAGTVECNIPVHEQIVVPVLRSLCANGKVLEAQALLDDMEEKHNMTTSFYSTSVLMRGYALVGLWPKVKVLMDKHHADDQSWKKVYGYASMFGGTIRQYAENFSPERVYNFVIHAIQEYSLFPTSTISTRVLCVCLHARRYDLVKDWLSMIQQDFPMFDTGVGTQRFAYELSNVWHETDASCEDILLGCKALTTNAIRDPFSKVLRAIVAEASLRDLSRRIKEMEEAGSYKLPRYQNMNNLQTVLKDVHTLITRTYNDHFTPRTRLLAEDLLLQTKAVIDIDLLFSGSFGVQRAEKPDEKQLRPKKELPQDAPRLPHGLRAHRLPPLKGIITIIEKFYTVRLRRELPVDHSTLEHLIGRLIKANREFDACAVIEFVYNSPWLHPSTGPSFDIKMFTTWLKVAIDIKAGQKVRSVLWAVVEAGPELRINSEFILLARIGAPQTHHSRFRQANEDEIAEVEYLRARLRARRFAQKDTKLMYADWRNFGDYSEKRYREAYG